MDLEEPIEPMLAQPADRIPAGEQWRYEPKWDGFRCLAIRKGNSVHLQSRNLKLLQNAFPDVVEALLAQPVPQVLDGELMVGRNGDYHDSFADLQLRLRVRGARLERLLRELPASFLAFDQLTTLRGRSLVDQPFDQRRAALVATAAGWRSPLLQLTPQTDQLAVARQWMDLAGGGIEGVIAKRGDARYEIGRRSPVMVKVKVEHSIDCVVGGIGTEGNGRGVLLLGLYDDADDLLHYVGQSSPVPADLLRRIEAVLAGAPDDRAGFSGRQPAEQHRWSKKSRAAWQAVPPQVVVETAYDRLGSTFRHRPKVLRIRNDKAPEACRFSQASRVA
jgi:ATP-dependent DNA ligase